MKCTSLPLQRREFVTLLGGAAADRSLGKDAPIIAPSGHEPY